MITCNTLSLVAEYLEPGDLLAFTHTCRSTRRAGDRADIWRQAYLSLFPHLIPDFGFAWNYSEDCSLPWKQLCLHAVALACKWNALDPVLTLSGALPTALWQSLTSPELPFLRLRRSSESMDSFYLNLLFDSRICEEENHCQLAAVLNQSAAVLYAETDTEEEKRYLRRVFEGEMQMASLPNARILRLFALFRASIEHHCKSVAIVLREARTSADLLKGYNQFWSAYCASMQSLGPSYQCLLDMIGEMAEARLEAENLISKLNVIEVMTAIWQEEVYRSVQKGLEIASVDLLGQLLQGQIGANADPLKVVLSDLMDLSANSETCKDTTDPTFSPGLPYQSLSTQLAAFALTQLSQGLCDPVQLHQAYMSRTGLFRYIFAPCTLATMEDLMLSTEIACARAYFQTHVIAGSLYQNSIDVSVLSAALTDLLKLKSLKETEVCLRSMSQITREYSMWLVESLDPDYKETYKRTVERANQLLNPKDLTLVLRPRTVVF